MTSFRIGWGILKLKYWHGLDYDQRSRNRNAADRAGSRRLTWQRANWINRVTKSKIRSKIGGTIRKGSLSASYIGSYIAWLHSRWWSSLRLMTSAEEYGFLGNVNCPTILCVSASLPVHFVLLQVAQRPIETRDEDEKRRRRAEKERVYSRSSEQR